MIEGQIMPLSGMIYMMLWHDHATLSKGLVCECVSRVLGSMLGDVGGSSWALSKLPHTLGNLPTSPSIHSKRREKHGKLVFNVLRQNTKKQVSEIFGHQQYCRSLHAIRLTNSTLYFCVKSRRRKHIMCVHG